MVRSVGLSRRTEISIRSNPGFSRLPVAVDGRFTPKSVTCWPLRVSVFGAVIVGAGVGTVTVGVGVGGAGNNNVPSAGLGRIRGRRAAERHPVNPHRTAGHVALRRAAAYSSV